MLHGEDVAGMGCCGLLWSQYLDSRGLRVSRGTLGTLGRRYIIAIFTRSHFRIQTLDF